jgi:heme exporter protein D
MTVLHLLSQYDYGIYVWSAYAIALFGGAISLLQSRRYRVRALAKICEQ